ncbi:phosphate-starvation-inducible PsiE family protein [Methanoregula sp.]|uniref:phosphate-starvation-inducible PsiE family protein n=1 Tax=Methanoregula sp. TaxID=2052170 RepID=UPI003BB02594
MDASTILKKYETAVYMILITLFAIIVAFSIGELVYILYQALFISTPLLLENNELLGIFGYFLLVLIGVELLATVSAYINEKVIHVEVVIMIAIIAIVRSVILLDPVNMEPMNMFGIAAIIFALCSGYYFLKKGGLRQNLEKV